MIGQVGWAALLVTQVVANTPSSSIASEGRPAKPVTSLSKLVGPEDYPEEARWAGQAGRAVVQLTIGTDGKVLNCVIAESSGFGLLDSATCRVAIEKMRFTPAYDDIGRPIASSYMLPLRWALPAKPVENTTEVAIASMNRGIITSCAVEFDSHVFPAPTDECRTTFEAGLLAAMFGDDFVDAKQFKFVNARRVGSVAARLPREGRTVVVSEVAIEIGQDGKVSRCVVRQPVDASQSDPCDFSGYKSRFATTSKSFVDLAYMASDLAPLTATNKPK